MTLIDTKCQQITNLLISSSQSAMSAMRKIDEWIEAVTELKTYVDHIRLSLGAVADPEICPGRPMPRETFLTPGSATGEPSFCCGEMSKHSMHSSNVIAKQ